MKHTNSVKILLVDDKPENLLAMESVLEDNGYTFITAYSAKEALKILLKEEDFALIIMDVNMPEMNGFDTASMIYKREKLSHIPIIFITAHEYSEENLFRGYLSGGADYIVKPVNPELLRIKVRVFVELYRKNRQLLLQEQKLIQINQSLSEEIKEKLKIEEELRFRNLQLSDAQRLTHLGSWEWNILTNKIYGSEEMYNIYELGNNGEFNPDKLFNKIHNEDLDYVKACLTKAISDKTSFDIYFRLISSDGQTRYINKKGKAEINGKDEVIKVFGTSQDITDLKNTEEKLKIFNLFEKMLNEIYLFDGDDFKLLYTNADSLRNLKYSLKEISHLNLFSILRKNKKSSFKKLIEPLLNGSHHKIVFFDNFKRKDKSMYPVEFHLQLIEQDGKKNFLGVVLDLTERKRAEKVLSESLKEKEILLKEIHHRVKNNLQIISSMLNIQKSFIKDGKAIEIFDESRDRIRSIALLHEKLYQSKNLNQINFTSYIIELAESLVKIYTDSKRRINLEINSSADNVDIDIGMSLGLILNELISNSIKHAFNGQDQGKISIFFTESDNNFNLLVKDNGIGLPKDFSFESARSLGLMLVKSLVDQINGKLHIHVNTGTEFSIKFPNQVKESSEI